MPSDRDIHLVLEKTAADVVDFAQEIGYEVPVGLAGDLAIGAGILLAKGGVAGLTGAGLQGLVMAAGGPWGLVAGALIGVAFAIYNVSQITDDTISQVIDRLEALDPKGAVTESKIKQWISELERVERKISASGQPTDPLKRVKASKAKLDAMSEAASILSEIQSRWHGLKFSDLGWDPSQAIKAVNKTYNALMYGKKNIKQAIQEGIGELLAAAGKAKIGRDYTEIAVEIQSMWSQLTSIYGEPPKFDKNPDQARREKAGKKLADDIIMERATLTDIETSVRHMVMLHDLLQQALKASKTRKSSYSPKISKRAIIVGDKRYTPDGPKPTGTSGVGKKKKSWYSDWRSNPEKIKAIVDRYNSIIKDIPGENPISATENEAEQALERVFQYGRRPWTKFKQEMERKKQDRFEQKPVQEKQRTMYPPRQKPFIEMSHDEIDAALMNMPITRDTVEEMKRKYRYAIRPRISAFEFLNNWGARTQEERRGILLSAFSGIIEDKKFPVWQEWDASLVDYVLRLNRDSTGRPRQPGRYEFIQTTYPKANKQYELSKRATALEWLGEQIKSLWRPQEGPCENILRLLGHGTIAIPGLGWSAWILNQIASLFGYGLDDLGKWCDEQLGKTPGSNITKSEIMSLEPMIKQRLKEANDSNDVIVKQAIFGSLLGAGIRKALSGLWKAISVILVAIGAENLNQLYEKVKRNIPIANDTTNALDLLEDPAKAVNKLINPLYTVNS